MQHIHILTCIPHHLRFSPLHHPSLFIPRLLGHLIRWLLFSLAPELCIWMINVVAPLVSRDVEAEFSTSCLFGLTRAWVWTFHFRVLENFFIFGYSLD